MAVAPVAEQQASADPSLGAYFRTATSYATEPEPWWRFSRTLARGWVLSDPIDNHGGDAFFGDGTDC